MFYLFYEDWRARAAGRFRTYCAFRAMFRVDLIDVFVFECVFECLKIIYVDDVCVEDCVCVFECENVEFKCLVELLCNCFDVDVLVLLLCVCGVCFEDEGVELISVYWSESMELFMMSVREKWLVGFRTKSYKFVVCECDE